MRRIATVGLLCAVTSVLSFGGSGCRIVKDAQDLEDRGLSETELRAMAYLSREVPLWQQENGCYSCHNNGDGARALYAAMELGCAGLSSALSDTTQWLRRPTDWKKNKGDPGFSDEVLARVQFASSLATAVKAGAVGKEPALSDAAMLLMDCQELDGSWVIEPKDALGSPATYGTHLATAMAVQVLQTARSPSAVAAAARGERWLRQATVRSLVEAAAVLLGTSPADMADKERCLQWIRKGQSPDGGWGPFVDSPPESFDTALVLLALLRVRGDAGVSGLIRKGRGFLERTQLSDGGWPETTRPSGGQSYAQHISTTGWALEALLRTREFETGDG